ncbi:hypothetical protein [Rhodococcus sp. P1Y]|uniref:hypothetical protein n=1 Tax=Rhodococcus sp. P1Y TaxID=1302308 RepID=UPI000EB143AB|nr:hypothetical protein [Rhodococcus sp. P1Y]AYJ48077.1 hypothetical protein D8W71_06720 [Rhodococcus sp. P1Y]
MRKTTTAALGACAAIPLFFAVAAPAAAAPEDVTVVFSQAVTSAGVNTVTGTFTLAGGANPSYCGFGAVDDYVSDDYTDPGLYVDDSSIAPATTVVLTDPVVADGEYTIEWACREYNQPDGVNEAWGTPAAELPGGPTATAVDITVPEDVLPGPDPVCSGSACLPTGSFGF